MSGGAGAIETGTEVERRFVARAREVVGPTPTGHHYAWCGAHDSADDDRLMRLVADRAEAALLLEMHLLTHKRRDGGDGAALLPHTHDGRTE